MVYSSILSSFDLTTPLTIGLREDRNRFQSLNSRLKWGFVTVDHVFPKYIDCLIVDSLTKSTSLIFPGGRAEGQSIVCLFARRASPECRAARLIISVDIRVRAVVLEV